MASLDEIHAIARPVIDPEFRDAATHGTDIAQQTCLQTDDSLSDSFRRTTIGQVVQPLPENRRLADIRHL